MKLLNRTLFLVLEIPQKAEDDKTQELRSETNQDR